MNTALRGKGTITLAVFIAVVLVGGAYFLSGHHLPAPTAVNAASSEELLQQYASKDSDGDGLPDWEEALYGTDPHNPHSVRPNLTDAQAVAQGLVTPRYTAPTASSTPNLTSLVPGNLPSQDSLTDQFSKLFFSNYLASRGNTPPSESDTETFVEQTVAQLEETQMQTSAFTESDIRVSGSGASALQAYAAAVDEAYEVNTVQLPYDEFTYFSDAVEKGDASSLTEVSEIAGAYTKISQAIVKIQVPEEAAASDLSMVNAMANLSRDIGDLAAVNDDPIRAMLGIQGYPQDVAALTSSLQEMKAIFDADGVVIPFGTQGGSFFHLLTVAESLQSAASTSPTTP